MSSTVFLSLMVVYSTYHELDPGWKRFQGVMGKKSVQQEITVYSLIWQAVLAISNIGIIHSLQ